MLYDQVRAVLKMWRAAVLTVLVVAPASATASRPVTRRHSHGYRINPTGNS